MSVFAKKKSAFEPSVEVSISIMLFLAALVYAFCFGNPYNNLGNASKIANLTVSSWVPGVLGLSVVLDFWIFYGGDFKNPKIPDILSLSTGIFSFIGILTGIILYWQNNSWDDMSQQAPRFASCLLFLVVSLLSILYRFMTYGGKSFISKDGISKKSFLLLAGSSIGLALSFFPLSVFASYYGTSSASYFPTFGYCTTGVSAFVLFVGLYFMNKSKDQEQNLCKTAFLSALCGSVLSLITLALGVYSWNRGDLVDYRLFYWSIFSYLAIALIFGGEAFYFEYVSKSIDD